MRTLILPALLLLPTAAAEAQEIDFQTDVWPVLESRCIQCHGERRPKAGFRLDNGTDAFAEGDDGARIVAGKPAESLLYQRVILPADDDDIMPPKGDPLTADQIETLRRWIAEGANWPVEEEVPEETPAEVPAEAPEAGAPETERPAPAPPAVDPLAVGELSEEQAAREAAAIAALAERGMQPLRIAQGHLALDLNLSVKRAEANDEVAAMLAGLAPTLVWLNVSGTAITDAGLAHVGSCNELRKLNLSRTAVTDAGLAHVATLPKLTYLNLYGTGIGDAGLEHVAKLATLRDLYLWQTAVTDEGVAKLQEALPHLNVNRGLDVTPPEPNPEPAAGPVNAKCPISGQPIDAAFVTVVDEQSIAFCCANCKATFDADPESHLDQVEGFVRKDETPEEATLATVNETCPFADKPIVADGITTYQGQRIGFCCANCKAKFEVDPEKYIHLVDGFVPPDEEGEG